MALLRSVEARRVKSFLGQRSLRSFLHAPASSQRFRLLLPEYAGPAKLQNESHSGFGYRGRTFAERDARAASHVQSLLNQVVDLGNVTLDRSTSRVEQTDIAFLFGSRSNKATQSILRRAGTALVRFEFKKQWSITCDGRRFTLNDPTQISGAEYEAADDYGVIARLSAGGPAPSFVIAGLGGRATEGCGFYFRKHWKQMNETFGRQDFVLVLRFPAPFALNHVEQVASATAPAKVVS